jgi:biotin transport system substrate-specific component
MSGQSAATFPSLVDTLWPAAAGRSRALRAAVLMVVGSALMVAASKVYVPFYPVPLSMQTFAVLVIGMSYGWRLGGATILLYLAEGAAGLPVFAGPAGGPAVLFGSTGGYLFGFVAAAAVCGWLAERGWDRRIAGTVGAMFIGNVIIYLPGLLWLGAVVGWDKPILEWGLTPFVLGDLTKLALAAAVMPLAWKLVGKRAPR